MDHSGRKYLKMINFSRQRLQNKTKIIGDATICRTLIILSNSNISHSLTL